MRAKHVYDVDFQNAKSDASIVFKGQKYRITILSEILIRLEYSENGNFLDLPTEFAKFRNFGISEFQVKEDHKYLTVTSKYFKLHYHKEMPFIGSKIAPDSYLKIELVDTDKLWFFNHPEARNFRGSGISLDGSNGKGNYTKGLYSTDGFSSVDDGNSLIYDETGVLRKPREKRIDTYVFLYRRDFGKCLRDYFKLTEKPPLIPRYAFGIWWNKNENYSFKDIQELVKDFNKREIPISTIMLGTNWHMNPEGKKYKTGFTFDNNLFQNPAEMINYLHERGIRIGINIDPKDGIMPHEGAYDLIAQEMGLSDKSVIPFNAFDKVILDNYFKYLINPISMLGIDFIWMDYYNPEDSSSMRALNNYHYKLSGKDINKRGLIVGRNNMKAGHQFPIHYSGETIVNWKTLDLLPHFNSTAANSGLCYWSHDIGGYKDGIEDAELYIRYIQLGVYSPIFRLASKEGKYYKREPWKWDIKTYRIVKDYCNLRHRLVPYLYTESYKYATTGLPFIQPLYYKYPEIYDEPKYKNEYYFGSELFIAPVTKKSDSDMGRAITRVYLPKGTWYEFNTGKRFPGDKRYVLFYNEHDYPVFAKSGSIIPLADLEENKNVTNPPYSMEIHIFPGKNNNYTLYEDDGYSNLHEEGYFIKTNIEYNYLQNNYTVIIRPLEGKSGIIPEFRDYRIRFRNVKQADDVVAYIGDTKTKINTYEDDTDFVVEVREVSTVKQLTINCKGKDIEIDAVRLINDDIDSIISDLPIETKLKEEIAAIIFSDDEIKRKRIEIRKMKRRGLDKRFMRMFLKLLEYIAEI